MPDPVRAAVFPVAGRGTRFLPATKASPKEMLPIVDKPLIQYAVEEAVAAGATKLVFVTGASKRAIEDHFDLSYEIEHQIEGTDKESAGIPRSPAGRRGVRARRLTDPLAVRWPYLVGWASRRTGSV